MPARKIVPTIFAWVILATSICLLFSLTKHSKTEQVRLALRNKIAQVRDNISSSLKVSRRPPLTTIDLEENIKYNMRVPFGSFSRKDWNEFWHILYGKFPDQSIGWPGRMRQLTREEVEDELASRYSNPFGYFNAAQWSTFWQHILKGKVFK